jgi:hypothetical protein
VRKRKQDKIAEIREWAASRGIRSVDRREFIALCEHFGASESSLRKILRELDLELSPWVEGVRQENFEQLQRTLEALEREYIDAQSRGDAERARDIRRLVITAKDHARLASRSARDDLRRKEKEEMVEWMLVWLQNPAIFTQWARLRARARNP